MWTTFNLCLLNSFFKTKFNYWILLIVCLESVWSMFGVCLESVWSLFGVCLESFWSLLRFRYDIAEDLLIDTYGVNEILLSVRHCIHNSPKIKSHVSKVATYVNKNSNAMKLWSIFIPLYTHCTIWMLLK